MEKLTQKKVKELFYYQKKTGELIWLSNRGNSAKEGRVAGWTRPDGYRQINIFGKVYYAHRLIWLYVYGYFPENQVDHIDKNPSNNMIENLRIISHQCNIRNSRNHKNNTSGIKGVSWHKKYQMWRADLAINYKQKCLGYYNVFDNAVCARLAGEQCVNWSECDSSSPAYNWVKNNITGR